MGLNPTPPPIIELAQIKTDDVPGSLKAIKSSLENVSIFLERLRSVVFDSTTTDSLGAQIQGLATRPKDVYTWTRPGGVSVSKTGGSGVGLPFRVVADSTLVEVRCDVETAPGGGSIDIDIKLDGAVISTVKIASGATSGVAGDLVVEMKKDRKLQAYVTAVGSSPKGKDLVIQARAR